MIELQLAEAFQSGDARNVESCSALTPAQIRDMASEKNVPGTSEGNLRTRPASAPIYCITGRPDLQGHVPDPVLSLTKTKRFK